MSDKDSRYRFMLEKTNVRGVVVNLHETWHEVLQRADYPAGVRRVLGHAMVAMPLLASTIKFGGKLTLQARGSGPVGLLVVQADATGGQRGLAHWQSEPPEGPLSQVFGDATLTIQIETGKRGEIYQGIVEATGASLQDALASYFQNSEQLPTELYLYCDEQQAAGMLLQQLPLEQTPASVSRPSGSQTSGSQSPESQQSEAESPASDTSGAETSGSETSRSETSGSASEVREEMWRRATTMASTITAEEMLHGKVAELLPKVFSEDEVRLFDAEPLRFDCRCSRQRTAGLIEGLGRAEADDILAEQGSITITCEFCNETHIFDSIDVDTIFRDKASVDSSAGAGQLH